MIAGRALQVTARGPLSVEATVLAVATALRVFERYPVLDHLTLSTDDGDVRVPRPEIERLLGPEGYAPVRERGRWHQVLARVVQEYGRTGSGEGERG